jgi:ribosomal protein S1
MSKKYIYGDPRRLDLDLFSKDLSSENVDVETLLEPSYEAYLDVKVPKKGDVVNVKYVGVSAGYLTFEGYYKDYIRVDNKPSEMNYLKTLNIGESIDVIITDVNENDYIIKGSLSELYEDRARETITNLEEGESVTCLVKELTLAGYNIDILFGNVILSGFMPNTLAGINKLAKPESIVGNTFEVMVESYSKDEGTYIVSRRRYLQTLIPKTISELESGVEYMGQVTGTTPFGVFVEFNGCLTGMIHKTNINVEWTDRIMQIVPGTRITFYIKDIINEKIILTQILRDSLWDSIKVKDVIRGKVKDIKSFGALIILDEETNGLIHTSELEKLNTKLNTDDVVNVKVIALDRNSRKIFLTLA